MGNNMTKRTIKNNALRSFYMRDGMPVFAGLALQDWKWTDNIAGVDSAGVQWQSQLYLRATC